MSCWLLMVVSFCGSVAPIAAFMATKAAGGPGLPPQALFQRTRSSGILSITTLLDHDVIMLFNTAPVLSRWLGHSLPVEEPAGSRAVSPLGPNSPWEV
ncbi:exported hypothetical protein [Mesorhizobium sp. ORS 3324]|nr:exported hypothetical protein [Mesorhizobium sp. ORS 3324]